MMTDPIADMLTRIRNGQRAGKVSVSMPSSKLKASIAQVLKDEGFIADFDTSDEGGKPMMSVDLKYYDGQPVIENLKTNIQQKDRDLSAEREKVVAERERLSINPTTNCPRCRTVWVWRLFPRPRVL